MMPPPMRLFALRGATTADRNDAKDILGATEDDRERISDAQLRQGVDDMMRIACHVAVS